MNRDWRWLPLTACSLVLLGLNALANDTLAPYGVSILIAGPCMVWPALRLRAGGLLACAAISGLAADAQLPTPSGFVMTLFILGAAGLVLWRPRLGRAGRWRMTLAALALNAVYFAAFTGWALRHGAGGADFWERGALDFCLSQGILLPVAPWYFAFVEGVLHTARLPVAQEPAPPR